MPLFGKDIVRKKAAEIKKMGLGFIPEDRHKEGLLLDCPLYENFALGLHRREPFSSRSRYSESRSKQVTQEAIDEFRIRGASVGTLAKNLSGGNQQKLICAREFFFEPGFLVAAQPTRGVDIGAIEFIHKKILAAREKGCAVLLISSELDEILALSDRILVFYEGEI